MKRRAKPRANVAADPTQWSEQSRRSYAAEYMTQYVDIKYFCWSCGEAEVFTAQDQKHAYEVEKRYFWQRRILCQKCWREATSIRKRLGEYRDRWSRSKASLAKDSQFLDLWLQDLKKLERYVPYKPDTARKNMLAKLIKRNG
jgi:hypothetical protein